MSGVHFFTLYCAVTALVSAVHFFCWYITVYGLTLGAPNENLVFWYAALYGLTAQSADTSTAAQRRRQPTSERQQATMRPPSAHPPPALPALPRPPSYRLDRSLTVAGAQHRQSVRLCRLTACKSSSLPLPVRNRVPHHEGFFLHSADQR